MGGITLFVSMRLYKSSKGEGWVTLNDDVILDFLNLQTCGIIKGRTARSTGVCTPPPSTFYHGGPGDDVPVDL